MAVAVAPIKSTWQSQVKSCFEVEIMGELSLVILEDNLPDGAVARILQENQSFSVLSIEPLPSIDAEVMAILARWFDSPAQEAKARLDEPTTMGWD